jgi:uncharacterized protein YhaN
MIIVSIRLHPFGKFSDRTFQFDSGVHVVTGPNEFGKSTMSSAIQHVLYTPSGLTPAKLNRTMGMWFPHPGGKNCAVTLVVEEEGITWTIQKKWGQGDYTLLSGSNAAQLSGEEAEKKISEIVVFNEATWDNVFHTSQAELADTVTELSRNSGNLDDLVASTSASALHDVSPDHFLQAIDRRISEHYSNWDVDLKLPRDGRGISKPWKQNVGVVLKAYYDWKNNEALKQEVEDYSVRLDSLQMQRTAHRTTIESLEQFVSEGVQHRAQFMSRTGLESDLLRIEDNLSRQKEVLFLWPSATSNLQNSSKETERLSEALLRLRGEYADAELSARSASMRQAFEALRDAKKKLEDEQRALETVRIVSQDAVDSADGYERIIREADIKIAAHRLSAEIAANRTVSVDVSIGTATAENLQLDAGTSWRNDSIAGTISIAYEGITFTVSSVSDNVQSFLRERQHALQSLQELLAAHTIQTTDELRIAHRDSVARLQIVEEARSFYHHCLAGRSYDEWETQNSSLRSIRSARSLSDINDEMQNLHRQTADHEHTIAECKRQLEQYAALYTDQPSLLSLVTANTSKLESLKQQIAGLPALHDRRLRRLPADPARRDPRARRGPPVDHAQRARAREPGLAGACAGTRPDELRRLRNQGADCGAGTPDRRHHLEQREGTARRFPASLLLPLHQVPRSRDDAGDHRRPLPRHPEGAREEGDGCLLRPARSAGPQEEALDQRAARLAEAAAE